MINQSTKGGYTLVELLFVLGLIFFMAGLSLVNYNQFGRQVELENAAYDVALTVRTAQFFGINRKDDFRSGFDEPYPFGVYFNNDLVTPVPGVTQESFMMFSDSEVASGLVGSNKLFDNDNDIDSQCVSNNSTECIDIFTLLKGNFVSIMCAGSSESDCDTDADRVSNAVSNLHITFKRPNPDATIKTILGGGITQDFSYAQITISSPISGIDPRRVSIGAAGQISIE